MPVISGLKPSAGGDDGYITVGTLNFQSSASNMSIDAAISGGASFIFIRFPLAGVLPGAKINSAYVSLTCGNTSGSTVLVTSWYGNAVDNAAQPASFNDVNNAALTSANVGQSWSQISNGSVYQSPELKTIIQEIVNRAGWNSGNYITLYNRNSDSVGSTKSKLFITLEWSSGTYAPTLYLDYTNPTVMVIQDMTQVQTADNLVLTQAHTLAIQDIAQVQVFDKVLSGLTWNNIFGDPRMTNDLFQRGRDQPSSQAASKTVLGTKTKYSFMQVPTPPISITSPYQTFTMRSRFTNSMYLGDPRITNQNLQSPERDPVRNVINRLAFAVKKARYSASVLKNTIAISTPTQTFTRPSRWKYLGALGDSFTSTANLTKGKRNPISLAVKQWTFGKWRVGLEASGTFTLTFNDQAFSINQIIRSIASLSQVQVIDNLNLVQVHNLAIDDLVQAQVIDSPALIQVCTITGIGNLQQAQSIENLDLSQINQLTVADLAQAQAIDNLDLTADQFLGVANLVQAQALDGLTLTQVHQITSIGDITQAQILEAIEISQIHILLIADISQAQTLDSIDLGGDEFLLVDGLSQAQSIENIDLIQVHSLVIDDLQQLQSIENVTLTIIYDLVIQDLTQAQSLDDVTLLLATLLEVQDLSQAQSLGGISFTQVHQLAVDNITQSQSIEDGLLLGQVHSVYTDDLVQHQVVGNVTLTQDQFLLVADITQAQEIDNVAIGVDIYVQDLTQAQEIESLILLQEHYLTASDLVQTQHIENVTFTQDQFLSADNLYQLQFIEGDLLILELRSIYHRYFEVQTTANGSFVGSMKSQISEAVISKTSIEETLMVSTNLSGTLLVEKTLSKEA